MCFMTHWLGYSSKELGGRFESDVHRKSSKLQCFLGSVHIVQCLYEHSGRLRVWVRCRSDDDSVHWWITVLISLISAESRSEIPLCRRLIALPQWLTAGHVRSVKCVRFIFVFLSLKFTHIHRDSHQTQIHLSQLVCSGEIRNSCAVTSQRIIKLNKHTLSTQIVSMNELRSV